MLSALAKIAFAALVLWSLVAGAFYLWALTFDLSEISEMPERSAVYDCNGKFYSRLAGENRVVVPFDLVSNDFVNALLAREDSRFYSHHGVDPIGICRAVVRNLLLGSIREGASTITQQLARNSFPLGGRTFRRKLIEAALAFRMETELTKEQILTAYMNRIYFGSGCYGIEAASQLYFGKPASRLDLSESALLAGLIRSPNRLSPRNNLKESIAQRDVVLGSMRKLDFINDAQYAKAVAEKIELPDTHLVAPQENWAMDAILRDLENVITREQMEAGGLRIYTSIDADLQKSAERDVKLRLREIESRPGFLQTPRRNIHISGSQDLQAAVVAIDNVSGGIRCIVGGRDYSDSKFHRALYARRQAGSTAKAFVYATALEQGMSPDSPVSDGRLTTGEIPRKYGVYQPSNSDGDYGDNLPMAEGLIRSRNTMTVRIGLRAGIERVGERLQRLGLIGGPEVTPRLPSLFLGAFETSLKDLTAAYTVFPNDGVKLQPYLIDRVVDSSGDIIFKSTRGRLPVFSAKASRSASAMLEAVVDHGTASRARALGLRHRAAGKTGTTDQFCDAWFVGFDAVLTCGVWVGFDYPQTIMRGGYAGEVALPIWVDVITQARLKQSKGKKR